MCVLMEQLRPIRRISMKFDIKGFFPSVCPENPNIIKIWKEWRVPYTKTHISLWHLA